MDDDVDGWEGELVRVVREVPYFDMKSRQDRSVDEFAAALVAASRGLTDTRVEGHNYYDSIRTVVVGLRPPTAEERAERDQRQYVAWLAARGRYEAGVAKGYRLPGATSAPPPEGRPAPAQPSPSQEEGP